MASGPPASAAGMAATTTSARTRRRLPIRRVIVISYLPPALLNALAHEVDEGVRAHAPLPRREHRLLLPAQRRGAGGDSLEEAEVADLVHGVAGQHGELSLLQPDGRAKAQG